MIDLISRSALIEEFRKCHISFNGTPMEESDMMISYRSLARVINRQPPVEAKPVVHGEWIRQKNSMGSWTHPTYRCSICGSGTNTDTKYCSECGASMEQWNYSKSKWE